VYPAEVEDALRGLAEVADVAVVGVPDARTGEAVKAFVIRTPGSDLDESGVRSGCGTLLARYKCPTIVEFVDQLPYNSAGKLLRRELQ
jgi:acyl-CoA synthetase (AMP-forming)/AMP-acid ligase II